MGYDKSCKLSQVNIAILILKKAYGINADVRKQLTNHLSARLGYTYTHIDATPTRKANRDGYVPKHAVNAGLDYNDAKWDAHLDIRGIINRPGTADNVFPRKTYWLADISANYRARKCNCIWSYQ